MKLFITFTKKGLFVLFLGILTVSFTVLSCLSAGYEGTDGSTHEKRMLYIKSLGLDVTCEDASVKETFIPGEFGDVYKRYNEIQKKAGFDLWDHRGRAVTVYSYSLPGNRNVNLIVSDGIIIGGDISDIAFDGEMLPLCRAK